MSIPKVKRFNIRDVSDTKIYDIETNMEVDDGVSAAKAIINDLAYDTRVSRMLMYISNQDIILLNGVEVDQDQLKEDMAVATASEIVELTSTPTPSRDRISDAWVDGLEYKGVNVFKAVYEDAFNQEELDTAVQELYSELVYVEQKDFSVQECYLGYSPSKDIFIMGFDGWYTERVGEEDEADGNCSPCVEFRLVDGTVKVINSGILDISDTWYSNGWNQAKAKYSDLIDIRLD
jgi:hypothetical protein